jgi:hypothetical protein
MPSEWSSRSVVGRGGAWAVSSVMAGRSFRRRSRTGRSHWTTAGPGTKPAKTYYAGVARLNDARVITLAPEQQLTNVVFTVTAVVLANLSGTITTSSGQPPSAFSLRVQRVGGPTGEVRCLVVPARPGEPQAFQCPSVPPGDFRLLVTTRATADADVEFGVMPLTVEGRNLTNLLASTTPGVAVEGTACRSRSRST